MKLRDAKQRAFEINLATEKKTASFIKAQYKKAFVAIDRELNLLYRELMAGKVPEAEFYNYAVKINRLEQTKGVVIEAFNDTYPDIMDHVRLNSTKMIYDNYYMNQYIMHWFSPGDFGFTLLNKKAVEMSVWWTKDVWERIKKDAKEKILRHQAQGIIPKWGQKNTLKALLLKNKTTQLKWVKDSITQGLIQGKTYAESTKNLKFVFNKVYYNTMRVVRTESNRNLNAGSYMSYVDMQNQGMRLQRMWMATFDTRTRSQSAQMDGQIADPVTNLFTYPNGARALFPGQSGYPEYDINERCTVIEVPEGQTPELRRGKNPITGESEVMDFTTYGEWMKDNGMEKNESGIWVPRKK